MKIRHIPSSTRKNQGFTLVELLVVIAIIAVLAALSFSVSIRVMRKAEKVTCVNLMRNWGLALESYYADYNRFPLPKNKKDYDTILGDPNGNYSTAPLVAVLTGADDLTWIENTGDAFDMEHLNPSRDVYIEPVLSTSKKEGGIYEDGKLYDPWGRELMFALNSRRKGADFNDGKNDDILHTWGLAEWAEVKPRYEDYVIWSYGADGVKGKGDNASFTGSDDVKSF